MFGFQIASSAFSYPGASHLTLTGETADIPVFVVSKAVRGRIPACCSLMDALKFVFGLFACTESGFLLHESRSFSSVR